MSTIFSVLFLYVFVTISKALNEIEESSNKTSKAINTQMKALFQRAFLEFLFAIACWVTDNSCCIFLQTQLAVSTIARVLAPFHLHWALQTYFDSMYIEQEGKGVVKAELRIPSARFLPILLVTPKRP